MWLDDSVKHVFLGTPALGVSEESRHRSFLGTRGHASLSVYRGSLKLQEIKKHRGRRETGVLGEAYLEVEGVKVIEHPLS